MSRSIVMETNSEADTLHTAVAEPQAPRTAEEILESNFGLSQKWLQDNPEVANPMLAQIKTLQKSGWGAEDIFGAQPILKLINACNIQMKADFSIQEKESEIKFFLDDPSALLEMNFLAIFQL